MLSQHERELYNSVKQDLSLTLRGLTSSQLNGAQKYSRALVAILKLRQVSPHP